MIMLILVSWFMLIRRAFSQTGVGGPGMLFDNYPDSFGEWIVN